ncbi:hypothetical protein ACM64Y_06250 [Novispirillum sp. DQ9]|uniref:hypothetical protein n=1 Tax=Novispirillum sp. DQ9 TaxID=3398612 RepID=UPI003C7ED973
MLSAKMFTPQATYTRPVRSMLVVHSGESPTADIYLSARLGDDHVPVRRLDILDPAAIAAEGLEDGTFVVIIRYVNAATLRLLERGRGRLSGVAYLMDDDIPGAFDDPSLPGSYKLRLGLFWHRFNRALARLSSEVWLSSAGLEAKYGGPGIHRINPVYLPGPDDGAARAVKVFYHAEVSHRQEALWLREVVRGVQERRSDTVFEIFGRADVKRAFRGIERCRIVHPMTWGAFLPYSASLHYHIGLAPLRPGSFNACRSFNKLYDISRCGAAGVFVDRPPYAGVIEHGVSGLLCGDDPAAWVDAICALAGDPARRAALHAGAMALCQAVAERERTHPLFDRFRVAPGATDGGDS